MLSDCTISICSIKPLQKKNEVCPLYHIASLSLRDDTFISMLDSGHVSRLELNALLVLFEAAPTEYNLRRYAANNWQISTSCLYFVE